MTHLPYVAGAYGLALALGLALSMRAALRLRAAGRRLRAIGARRDADA